MSDNDTIRKRLKKALEEKVRGRLHLDAATRMLFATDASIFMVEPMAVFVPESLEDLTAAVKVCRELGVSLHPRGAATGLAGESLGPGVVIDMHPFFRGLRDISPDGRSVMVGAGTTLSRLNAALEKHGLKFGPDPSSGARATIGGMVGNNATGAHSLEYGYTSGHVRELTMVGADGEPAILRPGKPGSQPAGFGDISAICEKWSKEIESAYPDQHRNRSGYKLSGVWDGETLDPLPLFCGSEGTLGILVEARLGLVPVPAKTGCAMFLFDSLSEAALGVSALMAYYPSALELIDNQVIAMGRSLNPALAHLLPESAEAVLLTEWSGGNAEEVRERMRPAIDEMRAGDSPAFEVREAMGMEDADKLWMIRREAEALIQNQPGRKRAISFIEDTAVPFDKLGEWLGVKARVLESHGFKWATFGHAGAGELHTKVFVDLFLPDDYDRLVRMARELYGELTALGGSISGEHGEGLSRSPFIPLQYPALHPAFGEVKAAIDPENILNPGRKLGDTEVPPAALTRLSGRGKNAAVRPVLADKNGGFAFESAACHGCGACRGETAEVFACPLFEVSHDERTTPRAKGNFARLTLYGPLGPEDRSGEAARFISESCFNCKLCLLSCPSRVDIPRLMLELKAERVKARGLKTIKRVFAMSDSLLPLGSFAPRIANACLGSRPIRSVAEKLIGLDGSAPIPDFTGGSFEKKAAAISQPESERRLVLYCDYGVKYNDHELGLDFIRIMNAAGWEVLPYTRGASAMPALDVGDIDRAKKIVSPQLYELADYAGKGLPIVTLEPTAALALKTEWPALFDNPATEAIALAAREAVGFLAEALDGCDASPPLAAVELKAAHHDPCHCKALSQGRPALELLGRIPGLEVTAIDEGCCGMAGPFGLSRENRFASLAIGDGLFRALITGRFDLALSECSSCRLQIARAVSGIEVVHPISLLARSFYGAGDEGPQF